MMTSAGRPRRVAVLGTGIMGGPMAGRLLDEGFDVRVWNRTRAKAEPLGQQGAAVARTPAEATSGADAVITMLLNREAIEAAMSGRDGGFAGMAPGTLWLQMSTVGVPETEELRRLAARRDVAFVDAPVLGTRQPAEQGTLVILASGPGELLDRCGEIFDTLGNRVLRVGQAGAGSKLKVVVNSYLFAVLQGTAEAVALAQGLGLDPNAFLEAIEGSQVDAAYAHLKGELMMRRDFPTSFSVAGAVKDARLVLEAAAPAALDLALAQAVLHHFELAERRGHGKEDMSAVYYAVLPPERAGGSGS